MVALKLLWQLLLALGSQPDAKCYGTIFGYEGDKLGREPIILTGAPVTNEDMGIAHRSWPIGMPIMACSAKTEQCAIGIVLDRGPYGAIDSAGRWQNYAPRYRKEHGSAGLRYRGCADFTPSMASSIGLKGRGRVKLWKLGKR